MTERTFMIRTEPNRAVIGDHVLLFVPEVPGTYFIESYLHLQSVQASIEIEQATRAKVNSSKHSKAAPVDIERVKAANAAADAFLIRFLLDDEAKQVFKAVRPTLPDRTVVELINWVAELYGGGSGNPPAAGGTSTG